MLNNCHADRIHIHLVTTYRQGNDERASRALDLLQITFRCCGSDGRLTYQNNVPISCNMFSIGCLTRTLYFLDSCMDILASTLLFICLVKLLIVLFFYSFLCFHQRTSRKSYDDNDNDDDDTDDPHPHHRHRRRRRRHDHHSKDHTSNWHQSSSFDSSSAENLSKKIVLESLSTRPDNVSSHQQDLTDKRHVILNDYDSETQNKRVQTASIPLGSSPSTLKSICSASHAQHVLRKLSSISEKTERTETDDSEPDLLRMKPLHVKRQAIITAAHQRQHVLPPPLPKKLPMIKNRRKIAGDEENDHDSGRTMNTTNLFVYISNRS
jgi:hypothetical protein